MRPPGQRRRIVTPYTLSTPYPHPIYTIAHTPDSHLGASCGEEEGDAAAGAEEARGETQERDHDVRRDRLLPGGAKTFS